MRYNDSNSLYLTGRPAVIICAGVAMKKTKVVHSVDIQAPRDEIFKLLTDPLRRFQLSPLWGFGKVERIAKNYPEVGSQYHIVPLSDGYDPYLTTIVEFSPNKKFGYQLDVEQQSKVTWRFQSVSAGTRVVYDEEFLVDELEIDHFTVAVREVVIKWLNNIKRYAELRGSRRNRLMKWLVDRYYLKLEPEQRKTIVSVLALQGMMTLSFLAAMMAIAIGKAVF